MGSFAFVVSSLTGASSLGAPVLSSVIVLEDEPADQRMVT